MDFTLNIKCDGGAFEADAHGEVAELLRHAARRVEAGRTDAPIIDTWGNTVGSWAFADEPDAAEPARVEVAPEGTFEDYANYATFRVCVDGWNDQNIYNAILKVTEQCLDRLPTMTDQTLGRNIKDAMRRWASDAATGTDDRTEHPSLVHVDPSPSSTALLIDWRRNLTLTDISEDELGAQARDTYNDTREPDGAPREQWEVTEPPEVYATDDDDDDPNDLLGGAKR